MNIQIFDIYILLLATPKKLFWVTKMISAIIYLLYFAISSNNQKK